MEARCDRARRELVVYCGSDGRASVQLRAVEGTVWLAQSQIAELYGTSVPNIAQIIRRVLDDGEVSRVTINSELRVGVEGARRVQREVKVYNLDMVLAVGYRVSTPRAVQFRQWATTVPREYLLKGFVLDDPQLRDPAGTDYFDELLARIRDIRTSEKRFYQKVREVFAATSADYTGTSDTARTHVVGRPGAQGRRGDREELPHRAGDRWAQPAHHDVPRFRRGPRRTPLADSDGGLGRPDRPLPCLQRARRLNGPDTVSASSMKAVVVERYAEFDECRRAAEAERAANEELDDLRALTAIEHRRAQSDGRRPVPGENTTSDDDRKLDGRE